MQIKVTDSATGISILRDVERIDIRLPNSSTGRKIEVYFQESIWMGSKLFGKPTWVNDPLILDLYNHKVIQALEFLKDVIIKEEEQRIATTHNIIPTKINGK